MSKIEKLTSEQTARFQEFIDKWTAIGLCTEPTDKLRAENGIRKAYKVAGLAAPEQIVWCGSPMSMGLTRAIVFGLGKQSQASVGDSVGDSVRASVRASVGASVWDSVWDSVRASVWDSVWDSVGDSVRDSVRDSVWASVWDTVWDSVRASVWGSVGDSVRDSVRASVWDSVWDSVGASVGASVWDSVRDSVGDSCYGQHDANWLGFYDYFATACQLTKQTQKLTGLWDVSQSAGWWLPHQGICWVSERHNILNRDDRGRLHCTDGPALAYPDGWSIWAVNGVRVPEHVITSPKSQTLKDITGEENEEVRRVRIERFGWIRFLKESGAKAIHKRRNDRDAQKEELYQLSDGTQRFVCVDPSTGRKYALGVPRDVKTCEQAQNWMSMGLDLYATHRS